MFQIDCHVKCITYIEPFCLLPVPPKQSPQQRRRYSLGRVRLGSRPGCPSACEVEVLDAAGDERPEPEGEGEVGAGVGAVEVGMGKGGSEIGEDDRDGIGDVVGDRSAKLRTLGEDGTDAKGDEGGSGVRAGCKGEGDDKHWTRVTSMVC